MSGTNGTFLDMSIHYTEKDYFKLDELEMPNYLTSSIIFNKIFKEGLSLYNFERHFKSIAKSEIAMQSPHFKTTTQYNLKTSIWGPTEILLLSKGNKSDIDVNICYGLSDTHEFTRVAKWLEELSQTEIITNTPGNRIYNYRLYQQEYGDTRRIVFGTIRDSEQTSKVVLSLKF